MTESKGRSGSLWDRGTTCQMRCSGMTSPRLGAGKEFMRRRRKTEIGRAAPLRTGVTCPKISPFGPVGVNRGSVQGQVQLLSVWLLSPRFSSNTASTAVSQGNRSSATCPLKYVLVWDKGISLSAMGDVERREKWEINFRVKIYYPDQFVVCTYHQRGGPQN